MDLLTCEACGKPAVAGHPCEGGRKFDYGKLRWGLVPWGAMKAVVEVFMYGARKYSENNWQIVPGARQRYKEAAVRHALDALAGEARDPESGFLHLAHMVCCGLMALPFELGLIEEIPETPRTSESSSGTVRSRSNPF